MYKFVKMYSRPRYVTGRWKTISIDDSTNLLEIPGRFGEVILILKITGDDNERSISFDTLRLLPEYVAATASTTLGGFLTSLGEKTLDFDKVRFAVNPTYASYRLLSHTDTPIEPIDRYDSNIATGGYSKTDLFVETGYKNNKHLGQYGLFSVNGFFHLSDFDKNGVYIHDGNRTIHRTNDNQVGVTCFESVGKIHQYPITDSMISTGNSGVSLKDNAYITIPDNISVENCSVMFVLGGYLYPIGSSIKRVSERSFRLSLQHLGLIDRYYDAKDCVNMDSIGLPDYESIDEGLIRIDDFYSDTVMRNYLTLPQSFIVIIESKHIFFTSEPLETPLPGTALIPVDQFAHKPLMGVNGRHIEYHPVIRNDMVTCYCELNIGHNYAYLHRSYRTQGIVDNKKDTFDPFYHGIYHVLNIGADN